MASAVIVVGPRVVPGFVGVRPSGIVFPFFPVLGSTDKPPTLPHTVIRSPLGPTVRPLTVRPISPPLHLHGKAFDRIRQLVGIKHIDTVLIARHILVEHPGLTNPLVDPANRFVADTLEAEWNNK